MEKPSSGKAPPEVGPDTKTEDICIPAADAELLAECRVDTFRSGGKGGQHQNKTESGVRLTHRPTGVTATARDSRSQLRNRQVALGRLRERLRALTAVPKPRVASRVPLKEKAKRVDDKKRKSKLKRLRQKPDADDA